MILESLKVDIPRIFLGVPSVLSDAWSYLKQHEASGDSKQFQNDRSSGALRKSAGSNPFRKSSANASSLRMFLAAEHFYPKR